MSDSKTTLKKLIAEAVNELISEKGIESDVITMENIV